MGRIALFLAVLFAVSNALWAWYALSHETPAPTAAERTRVEELESKVAQLEREAAETAPVPTRPATAQGESPTLEPNAEAVESRRRAEAEKRATAQAEAQTRAAAARQANEMVAAVKARILQIASPEEREAGLRQLTEILQGRNEALIHAALRVFWDLRGIELDRDTLRPLVLRQLEEGSADLRVSAAYALKRLGTEPGDLDLLLRIAEEDPEAAPRLSHAALGLNQNRAEGRVADLYVRLLDTDDVRQGRTVANQLRGMRSTTEVQAAVVEVWKKHQATGESRGLWFHILGQMKPMREPVVRAIFEALAGPEAAREGGLLTGRISRQVAKEDEPLAAELAADLLMKSTEPRVRQCMLEVLRAYGGAAQREAVTAFAENELVPERERTLARQVADQLTRR